VTSGTPRFVGARLREGREARGLSAIALAQLLGVTRAAVSQYEGGAATPRPAIMERICQLLSLPPQFFWRPLPTSSAATIFYRSLTSATKEARTRAERRFWWLPLGIVPYLSEFVDFPEVNFPTVDPPADWPP
jgi:transcriptional regulator with XRE-family HTH domain